MSGSAPDDQRDWEQLIKDRNWNALDNLWRGWCLEDADNRERLRALLVLLWETVPMITVQNGMEKTERHIRRSDDESLWSGRTCLKGAADILELGELEAAVEGNPPEASEIWRDYVTQVRKELRRYVAESEVSEGTSELSRKAHAQDALDHIEDVDTLIWNMGSELADEADRRWFDETMMEMALYAFDTGRHTQEAWSKEFEPFAATGMKVKSAQKLAAEMTKRKTAPTSRKTLAEMKRLIAERGCSVKRAADLALRKGFGSSADANRKLYQRHKQK